MLDQLQTIARFVTPIALDLYDKANAQALLPLIAQVTDNPGGHKKNSLEWVAVFPELRLWLDEKTVQGAFKGNLDYEIKPYEITMAYDRLDIQRPEAIAKAAAMVPRMAQRFANGKTLFAAKILRDNPLAYDGQNFFDTDHVHPNGAAYSNSITQEVSSTTAPTLDDAILVLEAAMQAVIENQIVQDTLIDARGAVNNLVVIARNQAWAALFRRLLTLGTINNTDNIYQNSFRLLRDFASTAATVDFVYANDAGFRPVIFVVDQEPNGVQFDEAKSFSNRYVPFGMEAQYAVVPGFPQSALRVTPTHT